MGEGPLLLFVLHQQLAGIGRSTRRVHRFDYAERGGRGVGADILQRDSKPQGRPISQGVRWGCGHRSDRRGCRQLASQPIRKITPYRASYRPGHNFILSS